MNKFVIVGLAALALVLAPAIVAAASGSGARTRYELTPNGQAITPTTVTSPLGKFDVLDAGVLNVQGALGTAGNFSLGGGCFTNTAGAMVIACGTTAATNVSIAMGSNGDFSLGTGTSDFKVVGVTDSVVAPTVTACSGGTAATMTWNNGTANFRFDVGTSCTGESTAVITLPATTNCWTCDCWNVTALRLVKQTACATTSATVTHTGTSAVTPANWTDGDDIQCMCRGG